MRYLSSSLQVAAPPDISFQPHTISCFGRLPLLLPRDKSPDRQPECL